MSDRFLQGETLLNNVNTLQSVSGCDLLGSRNNSNVIRNTDSENLSVGMGEQSPFPFYINMLSSYTYSMYAQQKNT